MVVGLTRHEGFLGEYQGHIGRVTDSDTAKSRIAFSDGQCWWFPNGILQIVEDLNPGNLNGLFE